MAESRGSTGKKFGVVDLYAGIGCVARGFERTGRFESLLLTDIDRDARDNYQSNFPKGARYMCRDIGSIRPSDIKKALDGRDLDGLLGCPPCQGFSSAGQRDPQDERNRLLRHYFRLAKALEPPFLVMENVPRVFEYDLFNSLLEEISATYQIWKGVLNAALYGLPQTRQRAIVIGYRRDLERRPTMPKPTHLGSREVFEYTTQRVLSPTSTDATRLFGFYPELRRHGSRHWGEGSELLQARTTDLRDLVCVGDAIGDLPPAADSDVGMPYATAPSTYAAALRDSLAHNHKRWCHRAETISRLASIPEGGGLFDGVNRRSRSRPYFSQAYTRLHRLGLARTITTNFHNPGSGRYLHYATIRCITVREAARLQGVEDAFVLHGHQSTQERLIGNAFPVPLAEAIASHIATELEGLA